MAVKTLQMTNAPAHQHSTAIFDFNGIVQLGTMGTASILGTVTFTFKKIKIKMRRCVACMAFEIGEMPILNLRGTCEILTLTLSAG